MGSFFVPSALIDISQISFLPWFSLFQKPAHSILLSESKLFILFCGPAYLPWIASQGRKIFPVILAWIPTEYFRHVSCLGSEQGFDTVGPLAWIESVFEKLSFRT